MLSEQEQIRFEEMVEEGVHMQDEAEKIAGQPDVISEDLPKDLPTMNPDEALSRMAKKKENYIDMMNRMLKAGLSNDQYIGWLLGCSIEFEYQSFVSDCGENPYKKFYEQYKKENSPYDWSKR